MCGIAGFWTPGMSEEEATVALTCMQEALRHRGPDDWGIWHDAASGVGFGQRRLAIIDLSPLGRQPMDSASGRYTINYNGEVFNYQPLMQELAALGHTFRGHSDTEVMLAAIEQWGIESAVKRFVGMFAFSLWDVQTQTLHLVRDRLGIKPLYYGWQRGALLFGSELKALRQHRDFAGEIDRAALAEYMRFGYIPAPLSIYKGIYKQRPGTILSFRSPNQPDAVETAVYWSARDVALAGVRAPFEGGEEEAVEQLDTLLREAVRLRMIADVPLGAFLSGGIDSSLVVALMQVQSNLPVRTFSIGFDEAAYNEAPYARAVARHLGTEHTELILAPQQALDVIPRLPTIFDEPFADSSQIPTFLVSEMTRKHVTVSLSGDGGDELFGGYGRYAQTLALWQWLQPLGAAGRKTLARAIERTPDSLLNGALGSASRIFSRYGRAGNPADKLRKFATLLPAASGRDFYLRSLSIWRDPHEVVLDAFSTSAGERENAALPDLAHWMMYQDMVHYLPDDILVKVDRASMAVALEARVPLLDHRVVEFAWRLPLEMRMGNGESKRLLRTVLKRYVPPAVHEHKKQGFAVPVGEWLRGPLRGWAEDLLAPQRVQGEGFLRADVVQRMWQEHLTGGINWGAQLWNVLMFQAWLAEQKNATVAASLPLPAGAHSVAASAPA